MIRDLKSTYRWKRRENYIFLSMLPFVVIIDAIAQASGFDIFKLIVNIIMGICIIMIARRFQNTTLSRLIKPTCYIIYFLSAIQIGIDVLLLIAEVFVL